MASIFAGSARVATAVAAREGGSRVVQRILDWVFKRERPKPEVPVCPNHHVPMQMRGVVGRPTRFSYQTEETYTVIYFCPVAGCAETAEVQLAMLQIPVPGVAPPRPDYARRD
jgi:hypothetical protein